jgi:hypothetical protein
MNDDAARPSPEQIRRYAESHAHRLLMSGGIPTRERDITAAFMPTARTNLEAVSRWIYDHVERLDHLTAHTLDSDTVVPSELTWFFRERLETMFSTDMFD